MEEKVVEPEGSKDVVSGGNGLDLVSVGMELERAKQLENFVGNVVYPRYQIAKKLLDVSAELTKKRKDLGNGELVKKQNEKRDLLNQIRQNRKDVKKTEELNKRIEALEKEIDPLKKEIKKGTENLRKQVKTITDDRKNADTVIVQGLNALGYRL